MSPTLENLKTLYNSFEKENGRNFFNKFYDYFSFVKSKPNLNNKIVAIEKQKQENDRKIENLDMKVYETKIRMKDKKDEEALASFILKQVHV